MDFFLKLKKYFARITDAPHICSGMKIQNNQTWWWHTNSFGVL